MKTVKLFYLLPALIFLACNTESLDSEIDPEQVQNSFDAFTEVAFPEELGRVSGVYFAGRKLPVEEINGAYIYQGDILLPENNISFAPIDLILEAGADPEDFSKSTGRTKFLWPDNIVFYDIDPALSNQNRVFDAINQWESNTAVKFVKRTTESNFIYFTPGSGCSSYIGMIGGRQYITLADACSTGNTIHEIGHAVGLWHEQSRADRDLSITVLYDNIRSGKEHNFYTYLEAGWDGAEYTAGLDFGSIMMYSSYSFSANGQPTITRKDGSTYSVQRSALSPGDIEGIGVLYPGMVTTPTEPTPTEPEPTDPDPTEPEPEPEPTSPTVTPEYINGEYYTIEGVTVLRKDDKWWVQKGKKLKQVELKNGRWRFVK